MEIISSTTRIEVIRMAITIVEARLIVTMVKITLYTKNANNNGINMLGITIIVITIIITIIIIRIMTKIDRIIAVI